MTPRVIPEDEACAVYTVIERASGGSVIHIGHSRTPRKMISRMVKSAGCDTHERQVMRKGNIIWFADKLLAGRIQRVMADSLSSSGIERIGGNRACRYRCGLITVQAAMMSAVEQTDIRPISENEIFKARGFRDALILRKFGRR